MLWSTGLLSVCFSMKNTWSLKNKSKRKDPSSKLCGIPVVTCLSELSLFLTWIFNFWITFHKFRFSLENPYALSFEITWPWFIGSKAFEKSINNSKMWSPLRSSLLYFSKTIIKKCYIHEIFWNLLCNQLVYLPYSEIFIYQSFPEKPLISE